VAAGAPIVSVGDTLHPFVDVYVPEGQLAGITRGAPAELRVDGVGHTFPVVVETLGTKPEFTPRFLFSERERPNLVIRVRVRALDPKEELHAGVPAFVTFQRAGAK